MSKREGFFQRIKNFLSEGVEETVSDVVEEIDTSIEEPQVSELPSIRYSPNTSGAEVEGTDSFYQAKSFVADAGREVPHQDVRYRQEHEPYRYEPEGDGNVCVTRARLYEVHPLTNNINIHELSPLKIKVTRDCVVYSEFFTNDQGAIIDGDDPDEGKYRLKVAKTLPAGTHFELPDENGANGEDGKYYIPLFYIKGGKLDRDHWNNVGLDPTDDNNNRTVQLFGGLRGHRGPLWWHRGYNKLTNIGSGKNVYKRYVLFNDEKELRSIDTRPQPEDSSTGFTFGPFSAANQINVDYSDDNNEIHVYGNRYNKHWKIGGVGVAVVQDGLVSCISDLNCKDLTTRELNTTTVLTSSGTTTVLTGGSPIAVLTGGSTTAVINSVDTTTVIASLGGTSVINSVDTTTVMNGAGTTTVINGVGATSVVQSVGTTAVINSVGTTTVAKGPAPSDFDNTFWSGGTSTAGGGLTAVKVAGCGATDSSDDTCFWVLGYEATGTYESSPPTFPAWITGASQSTAVLKSLSTTTVLNSSTTTDVHNSVNTTSVLNSSTTTDVHNSVNTTSVLNSSTTTLVFNSGNTTTVLNDSTTTNVLIGTTTANAISAASTTTVLTAGSTTSVYAAHASGTHKFLEAPSGSSDSSVVKVVECPTGSDLCPAT